MNTNCLVTKLKTAVDNSNLETFGMIDIKLSCPVDITLQFGLAPGGTVKCKGSTFKIISSGIIWADHVSEWTNNNKNGTSTITIYAASDITLQIDKYKTYRITLYDNIGVTSGVFDIYANLSDFSYYSANYINNLNNTSISLQNTNNSTGHNHISGHLSLNSIPRPEEMSGLSINNNKSDTVCSVDFENVSLPNLITFMLNYTDSVGNIENLDAHRLNSINVVGSKGISGDLKVWAQKMWSKGRTSGSTYILFTDNNGNSANVTWDGQNIYQAIGSYSPYIVFTTEGVSISATKPE